MTSQQDEADQPEQDSENGSPIEMTEEYNSIPDPVLIALVQGAASMEDFKVGLTLHVSGLVVSGTLVSGSRFFDEMAQQLKDAGESEFAESFAEPMAEMLREPEQVDEETTETPRFIHLIEARVFSSGNAPPMPETLWRGRLSHVSAWSFGKFRAAE